ncbi:MAG TPA: Hsp70 family protein [Planctomycetota bacterium]
MTILGIDLGTTNSLVAVMRDGKPETLANEMDEHLTPSAVAIAADGGLLVGRAAWDRLVSAPAAGKSFFKRDMGSPTKYSFGDRIWTPTECSALVLGEMLRVARLRLGDSVRSAVITVPAYFRENQRQATVEAAHLAGLAVKRIVNEPTAAALAYGYRDPATETRLLVLDLGGGTFDVTALEIFAGVIEVRASGGESHLGGEDYTDALLDLVLKRCGLDRRHRGLGQVRARIESVKRRLSVQPRVGFVLEGHELAITRDDLEQAGAELTARLHPLVMRCMRDADLEPADLDAVLLVGGASRMHMVQELVRRDLGRPGVADIDPDRVVALGAAVQAALCAGDAAVQDLVLTDVCAHTLGIATSKEFVPGETVNGYFSPLIDRNTTVPVSRARVFQTFHSAQDEIEVNVFQGEARLTKDNHLLGTLKVTGLKRPHPELGKIEVRFTYDMSGLLEVDVTVVHSGVRFHTMLQERPGSLSPAQVEEVRARLAPLKIAARERPVNRARLERANRVYQQLVGQAREELEILLDHFENALANEVEENWEAAGREVDAFLAQIQLEEGGWQPPRDEAGPEP